ncbi:LysR family transcriptional regulator [Clostridium sp. LY3-2]|uniref:LysR family transcriptional regulator n=1 Tax=Clostridium sp. LY3-2 TaxID=2942482 RepID=UPI00215371B7|nr:LysR family transcriptional regulator [Clostridium sp. LY3-2]MCR6514479.1 LysR family transcriptional regulator [Clostridium sp. LY3-2]
MEIRLLKYFLTVIKEGSISKAADALHITQPTLSRQLKQLEDELNTTLFKRVSRNISLTKDGFLLQMRAKEIVTLVDKTEKDFLSNNDLICGDIYIGCGETDAMRIIARATKKLIKDYPNIKVHLFSGNADDITEKLDKGILDFCVFIEPSDIKKYDFIKLPLKDTWGLLVPKDSLLSSKKHITKDDLIDIPLITSRQSLVHNEFSGWLGFDYDDLNIVSTYNLIFNASLMVEEGVGFALCLDKLINTSLNSNLCFKPLYPKLESSLSFVWNKNHAFSNQAEKFLEKLREELY